MWRGFEQYVRGCPAAVGALLAAPGGPEGHRYLANPSCRPAADRLLFDSDMRFLRRIYLGEDGEEHEGTFAFI